MSELIEELKSLAVDHTIPQACVATGRKYQNVYQVAKRHGIQFIKAREKRGDVSAWSVRYPHRYCVYAIEVVGCDVVKIGRTGNIEARFNAIRSHTPFPHRFFKVIEFQTEEESKVVEKALLAWTADIKMHGEWRTMSNDIIDAFNRVPDAKDITDFCNKRFSKPLNVIIARKNIDRSDLKKAMSIARLYDNSPRFRNAINKKINHFRFRATDYVADSKYRKLVDKLVSSEATKARLSSLKNPVSLGRSS